MLDFPTLLCCFNYANIYCLEISCLIISISIFPLNLIGIINIKWLFMQYYAQLLYCINLAIITFTIFMIIFIILSTTSRRIILNNYYKAFSQIALMLACVFIFLIITFSFCAYFILNDYNKIKKNKYDFDRFNKYERKKINNLVQDKKYWAILYITNITPIFLSFINIFLWISIYYRISFRIYCSFNYEIRKELRKNLKKEMAKLEEETTNENEKSKNKNNKVENVEISVVFEKDRHPSFSKNVLNAKKIGDFQINNIEKFKEEYPSVVVSSKRDFGGNNNKIDNMNNL